MLGSPPEELSANVIDFLSDHTRVSYATSALTEAQLLTCGFDGDEYRITPSTVTGLKEQLPNSTLDFWKTQAILIMYRAVPWKYLDWSDSWTIVPHLQHILQEFDCLPVLCPATKTDLALSLVEVSRYPGLAWKSTSLDWANKVQMSNNQDNDNGWFPTAKILLANSVLLRLQGKQESAKQAVQSVTMTVELRCESRAPTVTERCLLGQTSIQEALNAIQIERLDIAEQSLQKHGVVGQVPSLMEQTILFRQLALMGRIQRFRGNFDSSLEYLDRANSILIRNRSHFIEELQDFTCDQADTLRELERSEEGQALIESALHRLSCSGPRHQPQYAKLKMALAESCFALAEYQKATEICYSIASSGQTLLKMEQLRLEVTLAKLCDTKGCNDDASTHWNKALDILEKFPKVQGYTSRAIQLANGLPVDKINFIDNADDGVKYWIAGLSKWNERDKKT